MNYIFTGFQHKNRCVFDNKNVCSRSEMFALEKQVQEHNVAVRKNNYDWVQLKHTSPQRVNVSESTQRVNQEQNDAIGRISDIV